MLTVVFDYGGVEVQASDRRERFFVATSRGTELRARDRKGEAEAQCVLESFGAIELDCVERYVPSLDCQADYVVHVEDNAHAYCSFSAHAVPRLRSLGWDVTIADDYPFRVVAPESPLIASVEADDERDDWFSLELGVDVDGNRVSLLPALLDLLERCSDPSGLASLLRTPTRLRGLAARQRPLLHASARAPVLDPEGRRRSSLGPALERQLAQFSEESRGFRGRSRGGLRGRARPPLAGRDARARPRACACRRPRHRKSRSRPSSRPRFAPTRSKASPGCSTCVRSTPAACSPTTWASARRSRPSRTWCSRSSRAARTCRP